MAKFSLNEYLMGRDKTHKSELTEEVIKNAQKTVDTMNAFFAEIGYTEPAYISSGWRPHSINSKVPGAAKKSLHTRGLAIDIKDPDGSLGTLLRKHKKIRAKYKIWLENPDKTKGWVHCDFGIRSPRDSWEFDP